MKEGRSSDKWVDFNFGHQFVIHETGLKNELNNNYVDGHGVPVPHFGVVLDMSDWKELANKQNQKRSILLLSHILDSKINQANKLPCSF